MRYDEIKIEPKFIFILILYNLVWLGNSCGLK